MVAVDEVEFLNLPIRMVMPLPDAIRIIINRVVEEKRFKHRLFLITCRNDEGVREAGLDASGDILAAGRILANQIRGMASRFTRPFTVTIEAHLDTPKQKKTITWELFYKKGSENE
ncbi:MAG: hypothetical protein IRZ03_18870 [Acidobacterium ailaaui]|nr:hypothetical protein [Pseudacidobacterium ailaaui]